MTAMSTSTREININRLLALAARTAGIMSMEQSASGPQWDARASYGRDQLELIIDALQADGLKVRDVELTEVTLTAGTASYTLADDTLDVFGDAMYRSSATGIACPVKQISREEYLSAPVRTNQATPTRMYVERGATIVIKLLDVPDTTDAVLEIQRQRLLGDNTDGSATVDLERHWIDHLHYELAKRYAQAGTLPAAKVDDLRSDSKDKKEIANAKAGQTVPNMIEIDHPTPWD